MIKDINLLSLGILIILIGFAIVFLGALLHSISGQGSKGDAKFSFVGFIGPFPFGFGNDKRLMTISLIAGIAFIVIMAFLFRRGVQ